MSARPCRSGKEKCGENREQTVSGQGCENEMKGANTDGQIKGSYTDAQAHIYREQWGTKLGEPQQCSILTVCHIEHNPQKSKEPE